VGANPIRYRYRLDCSGRIAALSVAVKVRVMISGLLAEPAPPLLVSTMVTVGNAAVIERRTRRQEVVILVANLTRWLDWRSQRGTSLGQT
jgi:hypothetical protein